MPEDFVVEEVPLYAPSGRGEHTYFEIEKIDLSTPEALERLGRELDVEVREFGYAGLKDRKGITRQTISIQGVDPEKIATLSLPQITVLWVKAHQNKLRIGHLRGNRFRICIRDLPPDAEQKVVPVLDALVEKGAPNYFGPQRFGNRGDAQRVGRDFLKREDRAAIRRILGHPSSTEHNPNVVLARTHFMAGEWEEARAAFPSTYREERRILDYLIKAGENYAGAKKRLRDITRKLYFTAYQSYLFNVTLAERLEKMEGDLGTLLEGDVAFLHRNGAVFRVEDLTKEQPRAKAFEISVSGPIFGKKMPFPGGVGGEIERGILDREGILVTDFHQLMPKLRLEGGRRPLRVKVEDLSWRFEGSTLYLDFFLPKGSYATVILREVMKNEVVPDAYYEDGEGQRHRLWRPSGG
jgi:tRNA pseudouridine13 synthase